jgi:arabinogalactan oligomer/maltooligosaccharide transport system substrate-binding protein
MNKKSAKIFTLFVTLTLLLFGCSNQVKNPSVSKKTEGQTIKYNKNEPQKILVWVPNNESSALESSIESFEGQNGVEVDVEEISSQSQNVKLDNLKEEDYPDIIVLPHTEIGLYLIENRLSPIDVSEKEQNKFIKPAVDALEYKGKLYGLPKSVNSKLFVYNKKLIDSPPNSIDSFNKMLAELKQKKDIYGTAFSMYDYNEFSFLLNSYRSYPFYFSNGFYNTENVGLNNKGSIEAVNLLKDWQKNNYVLETNNVINDLLNNKVASAIMDVPTFVKLQKEDAGNDFNISALPGITAKDAAKPFLNVDGWFVTSKSDNKKLATKFIEHISNEENSRYRIEKLGEFPPLKSLLTEKSTSQADIVESENDKLSSSDEQSLLNVVLNTAKSGLPYPNIGQMREVAPQMNNALRLVYLGKLEPKVALDYATSELKYMLQMNFPNDKMGRLKPNKIKEK